MTSPVQPIDTVFAAQSAFRAVMNALSRPGSIHTLSFEGQPPAAMMPATAALALTLFDQDTPVWLDGAMSETTNVADWLRFHANCPVTADMSQSQFALIGNAAKTPEFDRFAPGTSDYPDRSTTLIVQVESLGDGPEFELRGPGIDGTTVLKALLQPSDIVERLEANVALFPLGIDLILVAGNSISALPRTTRITAKGG